MDEILTAINLYLMYVALGVMLTLLTQSIWRDWNGRQQVPGTEAVPNPPRKVIGYVLVDGDYAEAFLKANPDMLTAEQTRALLAANPENEVGWLTKFSLLFSKATLNRSVTLKVEEFVTQFVVEW
jgi:hypothetical protein